MNAMTPNIAAGVTVTELAPTTRIALRLASPGVGIAIGAPLPARIGERAVNGTRSALCLGPDEWLIEAPEAERAAVEREVRALIARTPGLAGRADVAVPYETLMAAFRKTG